MRYLITSAAAVLMSLGFGGVALANGSKSTSHHSQHHHHADHHNHNHHNHKYHDYHKKHGTAFKYGYFFKGKEHRHWSYGYWNAKNRCYFFYEPGLRCFYYWCAPKACYYPVSYIQVAPPVAGDETMPPGIDIKPGPDGDGPDGQ